MNDLATPLFVVFLSAALIPDSQSNASSAATTTFPPSPLGHHGRCPWAAAVECMDAQRLPEAALAEVEADTYWCLTKLLDNIQVQGGRVWPMRPRDRGSCPNRGIPAPLYRTTIRLGSLACSGK
jgi:hypothetical protein